MSKKLIVFGGPLGVGKSTIMKKILEDKSFNCTELLTTTTRNPRDGEKHGVDRYFTTVANIENMIENDEMIEYIKFEANGNYYGIEKQEVEAKLTKYDFGITDLQIDGLKQFKEISPKENIKLTSIFIKQPSKEILEQRLRDRGTEDEEEIQKRISLIESYLKYEGDHDFTVVNNDLETAVAEVKEIIKNSK